MKIVYENINRYFIPLIIKKFKYQSYVEIGIQQGYFTKFILNSTDVPVFGVDPFEEVTDDKCGWADCKGEIIETKQKQDETRQKCLKNLSGFKKFKYINKSSEEYALSIPDDHLDIVFIDGDHSEEGVYKDLNIFYKKIKKGGMIVGHDYGGDFGKQTPVTQVKSAADKFIMENDLKAVVTRNGFYYNNEGVQSFFIKKR